jgi:hypothetical protein
MVLYAAVILGPTLALITFVHLLLTISYVFSKARNLFIVGCLVALTKCVAGELRYWTLFEPSTDPDSGVLLLGFFLASIGPDDRPSTLGNESVHIVAAVVAVSAVVFLHVRAHQ